MAMIGENQVRNFFVVNTSEESTLPTIISTSNDIDGAVVSSDGQAAAAGEDFMLALKNNRSEITLSDIINPSNVTYAKSVMFNDRVEQYFTITNITADVGTLYEVRLIFPGYGSLSVENEYTISGFYKPSSTDGVEEIVDGLVKNLAYNSAKEQPAASGSFDYVDASGDTIQLPANLFLDFQKSFSDGTAELSSLTVTTGATSDGDVTVTLNGVGTTVALFTDDIAGTAAQLSEAINAIEGYTASDNGVSLVSIVADLPEAQTDFAFADVNSGAAGTAATDTAGADGTSDNAQLTITENSAWLAKYYVTGKKDRLDISFVVQAKFETAPTIDSNVGNPGNGTGYHVRNMEYYFLGNRGDSMRGLGYPNNFDAVYDSVLTKNYFLVELAYFSEGRYDAMKSKKQLTIACPSLEYANVLIGQLNTVLNGSITIAELSF